MALPIIRVLVISKSSKNLQFSQQSWQKNHKHVGCPFSFFLTLRNDVSLSASTGSLLFWEHQLWAQRTVAGMNESSVLGGYSVWRVKYHQQLRVLEVLVTQTRVDIILFKLAQESYPTLPWGKCFAKSKTKISFCKKLFLKTWSEYIYIYMYIHIC